jgi:hypothetical protein
LRNIKAARHWRGGPVGDVIASAVSRARQSAAGCASYAIGAGASWRQTFGDRVKKQLGAAEELDTFERFMGKR